jgi:endonuclease YncB( thermonuclease family)
MVNWDGYLRVLVVKDGRRSQIALHRLVALAFVPNPENKPQVNHKNGTRADCRAENLEWCTNAENQRHRHHVTGRRENRSKRAVVCTSTGQVFESLSEAARQTGARIASIQECCKGQRKTANGYGWAYKE